MRGTVLTVSLAAVRDDLAAALEETLKLARRLAEDARDTDVPVTKLVAQATMLGRLDQRREELIGELRRTASAGLRATTPGPPIREVVLTALEELGWPQNARFLEEYLWAKHQLQLDSRAFASLRRDELRAWRRSPGARSAYIVPALNPDGSANPRWLTSSAWDLPRRVIASPETERLFDLQRSSPCASAAPAVRSGPCLSGTWPRSWPSSRRRCPRPSRRRGPGAPTSGRALRR
jgi:hypothetical protein